MFSLFRKKTEQKLFYKTDVHCHLMPGVDHGSPDIETSLALIEEEKKMGIENIILTPHVTESTFENTPESLSLAFERLRLAVEENNIEIKLAYSAEYRLDAYSMDQFEKNAMVPIPGNYILLENSFQQELLGLDEILFNIQLKRLCPIMAHPERYRYYGMRKQRYEQLHNAGILFQVNLLSFAGYFGSTARDSAEWLLKNDMIDLLGSDMHNMEHAQVIREYLKSKDYKKVASALEGKLMNDTAFVFK